MKMKESQFLLIKEQLKKLTAKECFYKHKLEGVNVNQIQSQEDFCLLYTSPSPRDA